MSNQSLNMFWPIDYLSMTHRLLIDSFDRFKLLANETIFKHSEEKKENILLKGKSIEICCLNSLGQDLSQIILVVPI